jgi:hypothetical protein
MKSILKDNPEIDRNAWIALLQGSAQGAIYAHPDFMDVVAPGWQGIEVWNDRRLVAIMPLHIKSKGFFRYSLQPSFCQFWGIFFASDGLVSPYKHFSRTRKIVKAVVEALPTGIRWFLHGFAPEFDYPLPFHWAGFQLQTRYTYRIDLRAGFAVAEGGFGNDTKYDIRKASEGGIQVSHGSTCEELIRLAHENHAAGKHLLRPDQSRTLERLTPVLLQHRLGMLLEAKSPTGKVVAAALFAHFSGKVSYLVSAQEPSTKARGAMTLLLSKAIEESAANNHLVFDFEGSLIEGIEGFFRGFGGTPVPYLMIEKNQLPLWAGWIRKLR